MIFLVAIRRAIKVEDGTFDVSDEIYFKTNSTALVKSEDLLNVMKEGWNGLSIWNAFLICKNRPFIALIGKDFPSKIVQELSQLQAVYGKKNSIKYVNYTTVEELEEYIKSEMYGSNNSTCPQICFGIYYEQIDGTHFNYSLHYFDSTLKGAISDVPTTLKKPLDPFQNGPDMESYTKWQISGYLQVMKIINDFILQTVTKASSARINFGMLAQKYESASNDKFGNFIGFLVPFFLVIAYLCPLCVTVFRMVQEKESKAKEGMKIMGMGEGVYFLSYFIQYLITNSIYAVINSLILTKVFQNIPFPYILGFFWLYGMNVFALAFFFQAIMDKTRIAMIVSILVYFIMFFVSVAVLSEDVENIAKMFLSLLPPTSLELGISVLAKFETSKSKFDASKVRYSYNNFCVGDMYLMFFIDFFVYLFLGYYLQNIITHQFGIRRPFYFLCTKKFWCKSKYSRSSKMIEDNFNSMSKLQLKGADPDNFQQENFYGEKRKNGDVLQIQDLVKTFDDGKTAVDGVNLNLYKNEIFALLGHNGAGKSTMISILSGLYEATSGIALYNDVNILEDANMNTFRKKLGICPQHDVLFHNLNVEEHLRMFCVFKGVRSDDIKGEIEKSLFEFHLTEKKDALVKSLSGGQRRKLSVALALIGGSEVIFLDEPSSGMDITSRRNLWEILKKCTENKIIVLTTHFMEEASVLGKRIGIISNGKLKCLGSPLFLIERFGKFITLNISKHPDASNSIIIDFMEKRIPGVEYEVLSEEILFRIPKISSPQNSPKNKKKLMINNEMVTGSRRNDDFSLQRFFTELDENLEKLKIKTYGASMPTLEDVFLNVSAAEHTSPNKMEKRVSNIGDENDKLLYEDDIIDEPSCCAKFMGDLKSSLKKRMLQIIRDKKSFFLEILCPILLVVIGLAVSSVQFIKNSPALPVSINIIPDMQTVTINSEMYYSGNSVPMEYMTPYENVTYNVKSIEKSDTVSQTLISYNKFLYKQNLTDGWGSYYILKADKSKFAYEFVMLIDTQARQAPIIYAHNMLNQIISAVAGEKITINYTHRPLPLTQRIRKQGETRNNSNLVFFVSVAFALIPANFITLIIKEREQNTKHLQIISGISLTSYWISNFIFELIKYYFIGGINLLIILGFDLFPPYLWILYLLYGFAMVSFTYMFSFIFVNESTAQNVVILVNFLFGALGGSVVLVLRILEDLTEIGRGLAYILRIVPSYAFSYGFNQLLSGTLLFYIDYPETYYTMSIENDILQMEYVGADIIYLGAEFFLYLIILILCESFSNKCSCEAGSNDYESNNTEIKDSQVRREIERADFSDRNNSPNNSRKDGYSIRVRKLEKIFTKGSCRCCAQIVKAIDKLSFCLEYGECFALLGINGAGKTTTFKCLTGELAPTSGQIFINGMDVSKHFESVRSMIGYCPQFDAIFEYMTVYENLEFYAQIKGISEAKRKMIITGLMKEMNLSQYETKVSGNLSGGNKRKLSVAIAMIGNPPIVLLDEPSTGMDPEARRFMWAVIHKISTKRKKSSVILTTHSMEEAETLCRRMGIMVNGQFRCLGTSQYIKDNYGHGFEIDIRISPMEEDTFLRITKNFAISPDTIVKEDNIGELLTKMLKTNYIRELADMKSKLGYQIFKELEQNKQIPLAKLIEWTYFIENAFTLISKVMKFFNDITLSEFVGNNFVFKIKKNGGNMDKSIGFLFGFIEQMREEFNISEYSICQTSLEQIFNKFASELDEEALIQNEKNEILVTPELLQILAIKI